MQTILEPKHGEAQASPWQTAAATPLVLHKRRSLGDLLAPLERLAAHSPSFGKNPGAVFEAEGEAYELPRYRFLGPKGGAAPIRIGLFAALHGDEPEGVHALVQLAQLFEARPELAAGYALFFYPICNPTGLEDRTRHSRCGKDLNREFWRNSREPEVRLLEAELVSRSFDGIVALHTDRESKGVYGFARGATLTRHLLRPALSAAAELLPINYDESIDGFSAKDGLIKDCYEGVLRSPPNVRPRPFEIILETPGAAPCFMRETALVVALRSILDEYRRFIAYAANL
jgi:hypothetical protein